MWGKTNVGDAASARIGRIVLVLLAIGFVALLAAGVAAVDMVARNQAHGAAVEHTYQVERGLTTFQALAERAETARRGHLLSSDARYLETVAATRAALLREAANVRALVVDNVPQRDRAARLGRLAAAQAALLDRTLLLVARSGRDAATASFRRNNEGLRLIAAVRALSQQMIASEDRLLQQRSAIQRDSIRRLFVIVGVAAVLLMGMAAASLMLMRGYVGSLAASRGALARLNAGLESAVAERTADLTRANDEIQRFAYIVSHDLRSPLVNVMGFTSELQSAIAPLDALIARADAEAPGLVTPEARAAAREDLPEAVGFIRTSTQKMDRLINAILGLSRQGRRVLTPEAIDVAALVGTIGGSLAHRIDEVGAELRVEPPLPELFHDRVALEQILSNLIENAIKYRLPSRPLVVTVSGTEQHGRAQIAVTDNGRGIDARDHGRIFDLFRRSGAQTEPGEGIGLAHVRALAYRMGGTIDCRSEIGQGSTFTLQLPVKMASEGTATR